MGQLEMDLECHSGLTQAERIGVEGGAGPNARRAYAISLITTLPETRGETHIDEMIGDLNGLGEVGESVYGEKADIKLLFGDGISGDFNAIIMMNEDGSR